MYRLVEEGGRKADYHRRVRTESSSEQSADRKLSKYITHLRRVKRQTTTNPPNHYNTTPPTSTRSVREKQQKRRRQQSPQPLQPQKSRSRDNSFVTNLRNTLQYGT